MTPSGVSTLAKTSVALRSSERRKRLVRANPLATQRGMRDEAMHPINQDELVFTSTADDWRETRSASQCRHRIVTLGNPAGQHRKDVQCKPIRAVVTPS
jgi:hypothetical protein